MAKRITGTYGAGSNWSKAGTDVASSAEGTAASMGAEAVAIGDNTTAAGDVSLSVIDRGRVTTVRGDATASATADGGGTYAAASTYADVDGADFVVTRTVRGSTDGAATSTTKVFAIAIDGFDLPHGPIEINTVHDVPVRGPRPGSIDGNLAHISASATAAGDASITLTQTHSLTTDDYSYVAGDAYSMIG
ncbi:hypothetical protein JYK14_16855 [Siccirubricoccus sp. KC 17139]|uniref:Uncharacterized protein n=1 Tax=Siccirubricoccus soli TaxID=2899147 RepID=A0ABT1D988_9PROT|nr:hypothetical protein [Siccirubricoccus soli]MCO6417820.1 hypothetical protein [Siccirubricoccus soli]MCP2683955.1 hypothetical protein [Siccirubricoccus soli]